MVEVRYDQGGRRAQPRQRGDLDGAGITMHGNWDFGEEM